MGLFLHKYQEFGFSQLELLVAIFIFSSLGLSAMQVAYNLDIKIRLAAQNLILIQSSDDLAELLPYFSANKLERLWFKHLQSMSVKVVKVSIKNKVCNKVLSFVCSADVSADLPFGLSRHNFEHRIWNYA